MDVNGAPTFTFDGWGTSLAWWAELAGGWPQPVRDALTKALFAPASPNDGLGLNIVRFNLGAGTPPAGCPSLRAGGAVPEYNNDTAQKGVLHDALAAIGSSARVELFANSPPASLLSPGSCTSGGPGGASTLPAGNDAAYATYLAQAVSDFRSEGTPVSSIEAFNEPNSGFWNSSGSQEGMNADPSQVAAVIDALCNQVGSDVSISAPDGNTPDKTTQMLKTIDDTSRSCIRQVNTHSYASADQRPALADEVAALEADSGAARPLWMSEYGVGNGAHCNGNPDSAVALAQHIGADVNELHPVAWVYWQAVEDANGTGNWGLIQLPYDAPSNGVSAPTGPACFSREYYAYAQYTRFIPSGSSVYELAPGQAVGSDFAVVAATRPDGAAVVVATNSAQQSRNLTVSLPTRYAGSTGTGYQTGGDSHDVSPVASVPVSTSGSLSAELPAGSVTTYVIAPGSGGVPAGAYAQALLADRPSAYYRLDEGSGPRAHDSSKNGNDATYEAGATLGRPGIPGTKGDLAAGAGPDGVLSLATNLAALTGSHDRTVEFWFRATDAASANLFSAMSSGHGAAFDIALVDAGGPGGCGSPGGAGLYLRMWDDDVDFPGLTLTDGAWHYVAVTVSNAGSTVGVQIDGQRPDGYVWDGSCYTAKTVAQPFTLPSAIATRPNGLGVGTTGWAPPGTENVDEVAIYPTALSPADLAHHQALGAAASASPTAP